jgi:cytochrome P450
MSAHAPTISDFDPLSRDYFMDPQAAVQGFIRETPIVFAEPLGGYFVAGYEPVRQILSDCESYSSHAYKGMPVPARVRDRIPAEWERVAQVVQGTQLNNLDPPAHTVQRKAAQRAFTRKRVTGVKPDIEAIADELIDGLTNKGGCDLMQDFALQLTVRVVGTMIALPQDMVPGFLAWIGDVFKVLAPLDLDPDNITTPDDELTATFERLHAAYVVYRELLEERRANPGDDLTSAMLALENEDGSPALTTDEVLAHMVGVTAAGTDTTAALIAGTVRHFTESPGELELVLDDPGLWDNAVQESLRRSAVAVQLGRQTQLDTEVGGVTIPAGSKIWVGIAAGNADPAKFPEPLRFDVRRENANEQVALGLGRHYCLGAPLVPSEARIGLQALYRRLGAGLAADLDQQLEFVPSPTARVMISQQVTW